MLKTEKALRENDLEQIKKEKANQSALKSQLRSLKNQKELAESNLESVKDRLDTSDHWQRQFQQLYIDNFTEVVTLNGQINHLLKQAGEFEDTVNVLKKDLADYIGVCTHSLEAAIDDVKAEDMLEFAHDMIEMNLDLKSNLQSDEFKSIEWFMTFIVTWSRETIEKKKADYNTKLELKHFLLRHSKGDPQSVENAIQFVTKRLNAGRRDNTEPFVLKLGSKEVKIVAKKQKIASVETSVKQMKAHTKIKMEEWMAHRVNLHRDYLEQVRSDYRTVKNTRDLGNLFTNMELHLATTKLEWLKHAEAHREDLYREIASHNVSEELRSFRTAWLRNDMENLKELQDEYLVKLDEELILPMKANIGSHWQGIEDGQEAPIISDQIWDAMLDEYKINSNAHLSEFIQKIEKL